tara:strand:- start:77 stop:595 length:519 start_codon:yes stop_codon:yes gene_type:complete
MQVCGVKVKVYRNDKITTKNILSKKPKGIVISPGPKTPEHAGISLELIKKCSKTIPILGICLGHQAIAQAYGGKIIKANKVMHGKISLINHNKNQIYKNIPQEFKATRYHSLIVDKKSLPKNITVDALTSDNVIMGISIAKCKAYGVQFHPESYETKNGLSLIKNFINLCEK